MLVRFIKLAILFFCSVSVQAEEVRVAVAANFLATLKMLAPVYEQRTGDRLIISSGSSGKLYAQIINGAPYDLFLSADRYFPQQLIEREKAVARSQFVYARGMLLMWSADDVVVGHHSLTADGVKRIAIANPRTAPYGLAAKQVLQKLELWHQLQTKFVQGESVGQAFQFVATGNAQLGFVAASQVLNPNNRFNKQHYWQVPTEMYSAIEQEAVLLQKGKANPAAQRFMGFLKSESAQQLIKQYGYL